MNTRTLIIVIACALILFVLIPNLASRGESKTNSTSTPQSVETASEQTNLDSEASELTEEFEEIIYEETDALEEDWQNVDTDYSINASSQVNVQKLNTLNAADIRLDQVDYISERNGQSILVMSDGSERIVNPFEKDKLAGSILAQLDRSYED